MNQFKKTAIALGVAQILMGASGVAMAQVTPAPATTSPAADKAPGAENPSIIVVTGQRAALRSAQKVKQDSDEIVDSIVADDIGKLPDRSVTEVLQRVAGVTIDHTMASNDPEHYSVEGSGVNIRGLGYVRSELNGRDEFSANGGRSLNFEDVPPELMAGVDVYKNPSAEQIEGAISGLVNLRTWMPFDFAGMKASFSVDETRSALMAGSPTSSISGMFSNRWKTESGQWGVLIDLAHSESKTRTDAIQVEPYYPRTDVVNGQTVWVPKGAEYRTLDFDRKRDGAYAALEWKNSDLHSSLTFFDSHYKMQWDEQAIFAQSNPYNIGVSNGVYNSAGNFLSGTLTDTKDGGINFGDDTRTANRVSDTKDLSWNVVWKPTNKWTLSSDLQYIRATTHSFDSTVGTGVQMPKETVNLTGSIPTLTFDAADRAYLANPNNYYWAFTMEHLDQSVAHEAAWKGDAKFDIDDPIMRDVRFGARLTERTALTQNSNPSYNWAAITQTWQQGWDITGLAYLGDPRFSGPTNLHTFNNFFNGAVSVPALVFPNVSTATGYPASYAALHDFTSALCVNPGCNSWKSATFGTDPAGTNDQEEHTQAVYSQLRFGFDELKYPIDGNVGLRYVMTQSTAHGYTVFTPSISIPSGSNVSGVTIPNIGAFSQVQDVSHNYVDVLPSLNLKMKVNDQLQFRFAYSNGISRPDFSQLQAYTSLSETASTTTNTNTNTVIVNSVSLSGTANGNAMLKPTTSNQVDLTAEWNFAPVGSLTLSLFDKRLKDIIINETFSYQVPDAGGTPQSFAVTGPINGASGTARGFEVAFQDYFDKLPGWLSGFGVGANFTLVDSHTNLYSPVTSAYCSGSNGGAANLALNLNGCDINGQTFGDLPLQNLSRRSYNLSMLYDKGPLSARLAYNWRSKYLQAVNVNGTQGTDGTDTNPASATFGQHNIAWGLPTWADDFGQLDATIFYKITDNLSFGLEGRNITNSVYRQLMQQHNGFEGRAYFVSGPIYTAKLLYSF